MISPFAPDVPAISADNGIRDGMMLVFQWEYGSGPVFHV
jgi:hypothetical protein